MTLSTGTPRSATALVDGRSMAVEVVAADIGGTHARFAIAVVEAGRVVSLGEPLTLQTADYANLPTAWQAVGLHLGRPLPTRAVIAVASPVGTGPLKLTNNPWVIHPATLAAALGVDQLTLINDFAAVAHAVAQIGEEGLGHVCGPDRPLPATGIISIVGPGTGLGVAQLLRQATGYAVLPSEGGHIDFAAHDAIEDQIVARIRERHGRASAERVASGPGLANIYAAIATLEGRSAGYFDDPARLRELWSAALLGSEPLATAALDRFCLALGAFAGDMALAHGAGAVVIGGGLALRFGDRLERSGFAARFVAKGRFEAMMAAMPVKRIVHPQPGLFGAAAAFAATLAVAA